MENETDKDGVYILKNGRRLGPYTRDELLERVDRGEIEYEDVCLRNFASECERVHEILDWEEDDAPPRNDISEIEPPQPIPEKPVTEKEEEQATAPEENPELPPRDPSLILYSGHPSLLSFPKSLTILILSLGLGVWFRETSGWILFTGLILALIAVSHIILERSSHHYLITPRRVEVIKGLFAKSSNEVRVHDIRTINVVRVGFLGIIGVGRVEFASAGGQEVEVAFDKVWAAQRVKGLVRRLQDANG